MKNLPFRTDSLNQVAQRSNGQPLLGHNGSGQVIRGNGEFSYNQDGYALDKAGTIRNTQEGLAKAKKLFHRLEEDYGIKTAGFRPIVGHYRGLDVGSIIVHDYIKGDSYSEGNRLTADQKHAARRLLDSLTKYLVDSHDREADFLSDIGSLEQYVYQPEHGEYVLIDMDPYFSNGYVAEGMMSSNMALWARQVLTDEDYQEWHVNLTNAIKPTEMAA